MCTNCNHEDYYHYQGKKCQVTGCSCRKMKWWS